MRKNIFRVFLIASAMALGACGNEASILDSGTGTTPTPTPDPTTPVPTMVTLLASSTQISSNAVQPANGVTLVAIVKDANNNIMSGVRVLFSTTDTGMSLTVTRGTTNDSGAAEAVLTVFSNRQNRAVPVTASVVTGAATLTSTVTVNVVGTTLALSGPSSGQFNTPATYVATLADAGGAGIAGQPVTFSSTGGAFSTTANCPGNPCNTNASGQATITFTPTTTANSATVSASALGLSANQTVSLFQDSFTFTAPAANLEIALGSAQTVSVTWTRSAQAVDNKPVTFSSTRGTFSAGTMMTDAFGVATVTISSTQAGVATLVANGSDTAPDPDSTPTTSVTVEFVATNPTQISAQAEPAVIGTNQQSTIVAVVRDASNNLVKNATVVFGLQDTTGGTISAPTAITNSQGLASVVYSSTSTTSAQNGVVITTTVQGTNVTDSVALTVGSRAARIVLGTGNDLFEDDPTTYRLPYTAIVTDNAGNAAPGADLRLRIIPTEFSKGAYAKNAEGKLVPFRTATCPNEDVNLDGILQTGEDTDKDGRLDPGNVASVPGGSLPLDANGRADFNILYPQDRGNWVRVRLTATASVSGTEATESATFDLSITASDAASPSPPGNPSPYGVVARCDLDDENVPVVQFQTASQSSMEGAAATTTNIMVTVVSDRVFTENVIVPLFYAGGTGTATNGVDYTAPTSVTIVAGNTSAQFTVTINGDATVETDEDVSIFMGQPSNALVGASDVHVVTILNDD